jgi:hypothetical protein
MANSYGPHDLGRVPIVFLSFKYFTWKFCCYTFIDRHFTLPSPLILLSHPYRFISLLVFYSFVVLFASSSSFARTQNIRRDTVAPRYVFFKKTKKSID